MKFNADSFFFRNRNILSLFYFSPKLYLFDKMLTLEVFSSGKVVALDTMQKEVDIFVRTGAPWDWDIREPVDNLY